MKTDERMIASRGPITVDGVRLRQRIRSTYARARLTEALYEILCDALPRSVVVTATERAGGRAFARPIQTATEAALGTLAVEIERSLTEPEAADTVVATPDDGRAFAVAGARRTPSGS